LCGRRHRRRPGDPGGRRDALGPDRGDAPRLMAAIDAGLFGADSVAWRLHADPSTMLAAMRALLVQALEPRAMAGVVQHSDYKADPWGRLNRTIRFVLHTTYGDTRSAEAACAAVRRIHDRVHGVDTVTGRAYSAHDPDLL